MDLVALIQSRINFIRCFYQKVARAEKSGLTFPSPTERRIVTSHPPRPAGAPSPLGEGKKSLG